MNLDSLRSMFIVPMVLIYSRVFLLLVLLQVLEGNVQLFVAV
jgi:hypothetical protein